jgi:hypothetical protein
VRSVVVVALLLALAGCRGDRATPAPPGPTVTTATTTPATTPATTPTEPVGIPVRQNALRARLGKDPHSVREFIGRSVPRGVVLCGVDVLGRGPGVLYVWAECGDYRPGPDAEAFSGSALPAVVRAHRVVFPRQAHLDADLDRLFPPAVLHSIRYRDVHPTPTSDQLLEMARNAFGGAKCDPARLSATQPTEGGPAAGTFYTPVVITNPGPDCSLLAGDLVVWAGTPARSRAVLDVTGSGPVVLLPAGSELRTLVSVPNQRCFGAAAGNRVPLALSDFDASKPQVTVAGPGVPDGYVRCAGVGFLTAAGRRAAPSP